MAKWLTKDPKDGTVLALIPKGEFLAGGHNWDGSVGSPFPVRMPAYYIAVTPVTNGQWLRYLSDKSDGSDQSDRLSKPGHPVMDVSWHAAAAGKPEPQPERRRSKLAFWRR
jgi:formylglycine-generating enzyme required for sulfatase activity